MYATGPGWKWWPISEVDMKRFGTYGETGARAKARSCLLLAVLPLLFCCLSPHRYETREAGTAIESGSPAAPPSHAVDLSSLDGMTVEALALDGYGHFSSRELEAMIRVGEGEQFSAAGFYEGIADLLDAYRKDGFLSCVTHSKFEADGSELTIDIEIGEGDMVRVTEIAVAGPDQGETEEILGGMMVRPGSVYDPVRLENDLVAMLRECNNSGHPFCRIVPEPDWDHPGELRMTVRIDRGPLVRIGNVRGVGNELTRQGVVRKTSGVDPGSLFHRDRIERVPYRLLKSGFFESAGPVIFVRGAAESEIDLEIPLKEARCNSINGLVGYRPPAGESDEGLITGLLDLSFRNLLGTGRAVHVRWQRKDEEVYEFLASYTEPWVFGSDFSLSGSFHQAFLDSTYSQNVITIRTTCDVSDRISMTAGGARVKISPGRRKPSLVPPSRKYEGELSLSLDRADHPLNPSRGIRLSLSLTGALRYNTFTAALDTIVRSGLKDRVQLVTLSPGVEFYHPLARRHVMALSIRADILLSDEEVPPLFELFPLGGSESLRGYREDQFRGTVVGLGSLEYRLLLGRVSRIFPFIDVGYCHRPYKGATLDDGYVVRIESDIAIGYGFGLRIDSRAGVLGMDYGLGRGDGIGEGKVHLRMENVF